MAKKTDTNFHWVRDASGKKHYVMKGTNPDLWVNPSTRVKYPYSKVTRELILERVSAGDSVREIGKTEGFPPAATIFQWMRNYSEFRAQMKAAREIRGFAAEDEALEIARDAKEHNVQSSRLKVDTLKWVAEVNNPEIYGKKTKVIGDPNAPVSFLIDTGIRRDSTPALPQPQEEKA